MVQPWHAVWDEGVMANAPTRVRREIEEAMPALQIGMPRNTLGSSRARSSTDPSRT